MKVNWIVFANASEVKIYAENIKHLHEPVSLIKELHHPESRLKKSDLGEEGSGHFQPEGPERGACTSHNDPKQVEMEKFAREIAHMLAKEKDLHSYQDLILITPPRFYGLLEQHLSETVKQHIKQVIQKDYPHMDGKELQEFVQHHVYPHKDW